MFWRHSWDVCTLFPNNHTFLYVRHSAIWLTSLLELNKYRAISWSGWDNSDIFWYLWLLQSKFPLVKVFTIFIIKQRNTKWPCRKNLIACLEYIYIYFAKTGIHKQVRCKWQNKNAPLMRDEQQGRVKKHTDKLVTQTNRQHQLCP